MTVFRVAKNKNNPYVMINKNCLQDPNLSWKAKGILVYLLSLPDDFVIYYDEVITHSADGKSSFRAGIQELIDHGYVIRKRLRNSKGQVDDWETIVFEDPFHGQKNDEEDKIPESENRKPECDFPTQENRTLLSNNNNNIYIEECGFTGGSPFQLEKETPLSDLFWEIADKASIPSELIEKKWEAFKGYWCSHERFSPSSKDWKVIWTKYCNRASETRDGETPTRLTKEESLAQTGGTYKSQASVGGIAADSNKKIAMVNKEIDGRTDSDEIKTIRHRLKVSLGIDSYVSWFQDVQIQLRGKELIFCYPSAFRRDHVETNFLGRLYSSLNEYTVRIE